MRKTILLFLLCNCTLFVNAQAPSSQDTIRRGIELFGEEKYKEAISTYKQIHENDPNYTWMLAGLALPYLKTEQFDSVIYFTHKGLSLPTNNRQHLMRTLGTAYDMMGLPEKTIEIYTQALHKYPFAHLLHFNLWVTYL